MKLIITDHNLIKESKNAIIFTWDGYIENENHNSLFVYIDKNALRLRKKYLNWVFNTSNIKYKNKTIVESLKIRNDFSYWWVTSISEKCPWKQSSVKDIIRLLAIEEIIEKFNISDIEIETRNLNLYNTFKYSAGLKIEISKLKFHKQIKEKSRLKKKN